MAVDRNFGSEQFVSEIRKRFFGIQMLMMRLVLYINGEPEHSPMSRAAVRNLKKLAVRIKPLVFDLTIVDVLKSPEIAEARKVVATPTLDRELPLPTRRFIGDLNDLDVVLEALHLFSASARSTSADPNPEVKT